MTASRPSRIVQLVAATTVAVLASSTLGVRAACPTGWVPAAAKPGSCIASTFDLNGGADNLDTWAGARGICAGFGGDLYSPVSADGSAEEAQLQSIIAATASAGAAAGGQTWIGVFREGSPSGPFTPAWMTVDGSLNDAGLNCGSANCGLWVYNPANAGTDHPVTGGVCARWVQSQTGIMSLGGACSQNYNAICEIKPDADNDGVIDFFDLCPDTTRDAPIDPNGCARHQVDADEDCVCNTLPLLDNGKFAKTKWCNVPGFKLAGQSSFTPVLDICPDVPNPALPSATNPSKCQTKDGTGGVIPVDFTVMTSTIMYMGGDVSATVYGPLQPNVCGSSEPSASSTSGSSADSSSSSEADVSAPSEEKPEEPVYYTQVEVAEEAPEEKPYRAPVAEEEPDKEPYRAPAPAPAPAIEEEEHVAEEEPVPEAEEETAGAAAPADAELAASADADDSAASAPSGASSGASSGIAMAAIGVAVAATALVAVGVAVAVRRRRMQAASSSSADNLKATAKSPRMPSGSPVDPDSSILVDAGVMSTSSSSAASESAEPKSHSKSRSKSSKKGKHVRRARSSSRTRRGRSRSRSRSHASRAAAPTSTGEQAV